MAQLQTLIVGKTAMIGFKIRNKIDMRQPKPHLFSYTGANQKISISV